MHRSDAPPLQPIPMLPLPLLWAAPLPQPFPCSPPPPSPPCRDWAANKRQLFGLIAPHSGGGTAQQYAGQRGTSISGRVIWPWLGSGLDPVWIQRIYRTSLIKYPTLGLRGSVRLGYSICMVCKNSAQAISCADLCGSMRICADL